MKKREITQNFQLGMSVIEIVLASAIFMIFSTSAVKSLLQNYNANRTGAEYTVATQFASEGLEAVRSIKNQSFNNLLAVNTTPRGLQQIGGVWSFNTDGSNNTLTHNSADNYTRQVVIESVQRNGVPPAGDIVASGTNDPNTKKVTSTVTWNFSPTRTETVTVSTYLSNWIKRLTKDGIIVYSDGSVIPKYRLFDKNTGLFDTTAQNTVSGGVGQYFSLKTSPTKTEAVVGYITSAGLLQVMCFDGSTWSNDWSVNVGGTGTTRRFDIAYEANTGDAMIVYSRNAAGANTLAYRTKSGSLGCGSANWPVATNFATSPSATTGTVQWVKMARDSRSSSNNMTAIWADSNGDLGVNNWSGTAWATGVGTFKVLETQLDVITTAQDVDNFDVAYESLSGDIMVVWGDGFGNNGTNGANYSTCNGGVSTCSWSAKTAVPTVSDDVHNLDLASNPNTDQMAYAAIGDTGDDLTAAYWSGTAWTGYANLDTTTESPAAGTKLVSATWLINGAQTRWVANYDDASGTGISWYYATPGSAPVKPADFSAVPSINDIRQRYEADSDPIDKNRAIITVTDSTRNVYSKMINMDATGTLGVANWSNADSGTSIGITPVVPPQGFAYFFWRFP